MIHQPKLESFPSSIWKAFLFLLFVTLVKTIIEISVGIASGVYISIFAAFTGGNFDEILLNSTNILNLVAVTIADLLLISILISFTKKRRVEPIHFRQSLKFLPESKTILLSIFGILAVALAGGLVTNTISSLFSAETPEHIEALMNVSGFFTFETLLTVIAVVLVAPLFEEFFIRKLLMDGLLKSNGPLVSILTSAVFFAVFHMNIVQGAYTFILGLYLAFLYYKTGSFALVFIVHALNNLYAVLVRNLPTSTHEYIGYVTIFVGVPAFLGLIRRLRSTTFKWETAEILLEESDITDTSFNVVPAKNTTPDAND